MSFEKIKLNSVLPLHSNNEVKFFNEEEAKQVTEVAQKLLCEIVKEMKANGISTGSSNK
jgi:hypothetical protein